MPSGNRYLPPPVLEESVVKSLPDFSDDADWRECVRWIVMSSNELCKGESSRLVMAELEEAGSDQVLSDAEKAKRGLHAAAAAAGVALENTYARLFFTSVYGFAVVNSEAVLEACRHGPLLEIGAGCGYVARLLADQGADVVATDSFEWAAAAAVNPILTFRKMWYDVASVGACDAVRKWNSRALLITWPYPGQTWAAEAIQLTQSNTVIIIGETGKGACTADPFLNNPAWHESIRLAINNWPHVADVLRVFHRV
ncbi:hypothetical protein DIPPA_23520 [Diplonema papillatum]|nr:hypothetical protein DIPPA_23520 [Diplonema papillatum]